MPPDAALGQDLPGWRWEHNHCFSSKSAYAAIDFDVSHVRDFSWRMLWSIKLPQRIRVFLWMAVHDNLMSNGNVDILLILMMAQSVWRVVIKRDMLQDYCTMTYGVWLDLNLHGASGFVCDSLANCWAKVVALCRDSLYGSMVFDYVPVALAELVHKEVVNT
ncbi:hypothetical protein V6N13_084114 [Hibiscus sabdariffa]